MGFIIIGAGKLFVSHNFLGMHLLPVIYSDHVLLKEQNTSASQSS